MRRCPSPAAADSGQVDLVRSWAFALTLQRSDRGLSPPVRDKVLGSSGWQHRPARQNDRLSCCDLLAQHGLYLIFAGGLEAIRPGLQCLLSLAAGTQR